MRSRTFRGSQLVLLALGFFFSDMAHLFAQDVRVETQQQARARAEQTVEQEQAPEVVTDPELGDIVLVSRAPRPKMFTLSTFQTLNYTTNAFLVRDGAQGNFYWNGRLGMTFVPYATRDFTPSLTISQDWFRYDSLSELDFDAQNLQLDLKYDLNHDDTWYIVGSYLATRLTTPGGDEFYRYGFLNGSVTHVIPLRSAPVSLAITGGVYSRHGDPSASDRVSGYLNFAAIYNIRPTLQLSGFTRPEYQHYTHDPLGSRDDFNLTVGGTLSWVPNQYVALAATVAYIGNFSSIDVRRYDVVTPSLVLAAQFSF